MKIVKVEFEDILELKDVVIDKMPDKIQLPIIEIFGYLLRETENYIMITNMQDKFIDDLIEKTTSKATVWYIPRSCVKKITELKEVAI